MGAWLRGLIKNVIIIILQYMERGWSIDHRDHVVLLTF